eukprot:gene21537-28529_t
MPSGAPRSGAQTRSQSTQTSGAKKKTKVEVHRPRPKWCTRSWCNHTQRPSGAQVEGWHSPILRPKWCTKVEGAPDPDPSGAPRSRVHQTQTQAHVGTTTVRGCTRQGSQTNGAPRSRVHQTQLRPQVVPKVDGAPAEKPKWCTQVEGAPTRLRPKWWPPSGTKVEVHQTKDPSGAPGRGCTAPDTSGAPRARCAPDPRLRPKVVHKVRVHQDQDPSGAPR